MRIRTCGKTPLCRPRLKGRGGSFGWQLEMTPIGKLLRGSGLLWQVEHHCQDCEGYAPTRGHCSYVVRLPCSLPMMMNSSIHAFLSDNREWWIIARSVSCSRCGTYASHMQRSHCSSIEKNRTHRGQDNRILLSMKRRVYRKCMLLGRAIEPFLSTCSVSRLSLVQLCVGLTMTIVA